MTKSKSFFFSPANTNDKKKNVLEIFLKNILWGRKYFYQHYIIHVVLPVGFALADTMF